MKKLLALILLITIAFGAFACNSPTDASDNATQAPTESAVDLKEGEFLLLDEYSLICAASLRSNDTVNDALDYLKEALIACGSKGFISIDSNTHDRKGEIIIGNTSREQSTEMREGMKIDEYAYSVVSQNEIVICGGSNLSTFEAVKKFCEDILGYTRESESADLVPVLKAGSEYRYTSDKYAISEFFIEGVPFSDFKIAIARDRDSIYADLFVQSLGAYTGYALPVVSYDEISSLDRGVICVGYYDREKSNGLPAGISGYSVRFYEENGALTVGVGASGGANYELAAKKLAEALAPEQEAQSLELPKIPISDIDYSTSSEYTPEWFLQSEQSEIISDGVEYKEFFYTDDKGRPYRAYALFIDPEKNSLIMGSAEDEYDFTTDSPQTVAGHMLAANGNGFEVVAGVNADFFNMGGDNSPLGIAVKEGVLISKGGDGRAYFALTKDGRVEIGTDGAGANVTDLRTAVGGSDVIVRNGFPLSFDMTNNSFNYTSHPRTLAGVREDGTIILAVIDGRQPSVSNGASLERCALFMFSLGAMDAINLDGGGSTCMVLNRDGEMVTESSASGGSLRRVYNSLIVIKNK